MNQRYNAYFENGDIVIGPNEGTTISEKEQEFILESEKFQNNIKIIFEKNIEKRKYYLTRLLDHIEAGLNDPIYLDIAKKANDQLKNEILLETSSYVKNKFIKSFSITAAAYLTILILASIVFFWADLNYKSKIFDYNILQSFSTLFLGTTIGVWTSTALAKMNLKFEDIITINTDEFNNHIRILFSIVLSFVFGLLFLKQIIVIKIGTINSDSCFSDVYVPIIFGFFFGLNEKILGSKLISKINDIIKF